MTTAASTTTETLTIGSGKSLHAIDARYLDTLGKRPLCGGTRSNGAAQRIRAYSGRTVTCKACLKALAAQGIPTGTYEEQVAQAEAAVSAAEATLRDAHDVLTDLRMIKHRETPAYREAVAFMAYADQLKAAASEATDQELRDQLAAPGTDYNVREYAKAELADRKAGRR